MFETASEASGLDIAKLCFEENEQINQTEYTQICMLAAEMAVLRAVEGKGVRSSVNAGLSLGEYGALVASGAMGLKDAFKVVRRRGILMQEAVPAGGAMAAVLAMDAAKIEEVCGQTEGIVSVANYNCPGQIVITGEEDAVDAACEALKAAGAKRTIRLNVSGPFHSQMLLAAGENAVYYQCDGGLCDFHRRDQRASLPSGVLQCALAAVHGAHDRRRRGYVHRDGTGKNTVRFYAEDQPGCEDDEY